MGSTDLILLANKQKHLAGQLTSPRTVASATAIHDWAIHVLIHYISDQRFTESIYWFIIALYCLFSSCVCPSACADSKKTVISEG